MNKTKETLFELFQLDKMPVEKAEEMLGRLSKLVFQAVLVRVLPLLSEEDYNEYEAILDSDKEADELFFFLSKKVPDFDKIIQEEAELLRLELAKEIK